jgi:hypothetical protein
VFLWSSEVFLQLFHIKKKPILICICFINQHTTAPPKLISPPEEDVSTAVMDVMDVMDNSENVPAPPEFRKGIQRFCRENSFLSI